MDSSEPAVGTVSTGLGFRVWGLGWCLETFQVYESIWKEKVHESVQDMKVCESICKHVEYKVYKSICKCKESIEERVLVAISCHKTQNHEQNALCVPKTLLVS